MGRSRACYPRFRAGAKIARHRHGRADVRYAVRLMDGTTSPALQALFRCIVARRFVIVACAALIVPVAVVRALRVESDPSIARLIVESDPDFRANREFQALFPEGEQVVLLLDAPDPFAPAALA